MPLTAPSVDLSIEPQTSVRGMAQAAVAAGIVPLASITGRTHDLVVLNPLTGLFEEYRSVLLYGHRPAGWQLAVPAALIMKQPDLGTALLVLAAGLSVIFFAGLSWKLIVPVLAPASPRSMPSLLLPEIRLLMTWLLSAALSMLLVPRKRAAFCPA